MQVARWWRVVQPAATLAVGAGAGGVRGMMQRCSGRRAVAAAANAACVRPLAPAVALQRASLVTLARQYSIGGVSISSSLGWFARASVTASRYLGTRSFALSARRVVSLLPHGRLTPQSMASLEHSGNSALAVTQPSLCATLPAQRLTQLQQQVRGIKTAKRQIKRHYRQKTKYKMKTKKAVASRFKLLKSGGIKYWRRGRVHNSQAKTKKQHRQLRRPKVLASGTMFKKLRRALQY